MLKGEQCGVETTKDHAWIYIKEDNWTIFDVYNYKVQTTLKITAGANAHHMKETKLEYGIWTSERIFYDKFSYHDEA